MALIIPLSLRYSALRQGRMKGASEQTALAKKTSSDLHYSAPDERDRSAPVRSLHGIDDQHTRANSHRIVRSCLQYVFPYFFLVT